MAQPYNIGVKVGADIDPLKRDLRRGSQTIGDFADKARGSLSKMAVAFTAAGAAAAAGLGAAYKAGADLTDQQAKMARAVVGTTDGLRALAHAANLAGVSFGSIEADVRKLNAALSEPSSNVAETLEELSLNADQLLRMDVDGRVAAISDRMRELGYTTAQADVAMKGLGIDAGAQLTKMMVDGGDAIRAAREELAAWGLELSDIDAVKVENANDAFTRAQTILSGLGQVFAGKVAPYVEALIKKFTDAAREGEGIGARVGRSLSSVITALAFVANAAGGVERTFMIAGSAIASFALELQRDVLSVASRIVEGPVKALNSLITVANKIPGIDVTPVARPEIVQNMIDRAWEMEYAFRESRAGINELLMEPLPGDAFKQWAEEVQAAADAAAEAVVKTRQSTVTTPNADTGGEDPFGTDNEKYRKQFPDEFDLGGDDPFATEQELFAQHWDEMNRIAVEGAGGISQIMAQQWGNAAGSTAAAGKSMLESFSQSSRKMFEINKAWGVADAIVSTAQGIAAGVKLGWPMGIPAVAWAVANGAAQISRIRSTQFGGGGGTPTATTSAPAQGQAAPGTNALGGQESGRTLRIEGLRADSLYTGNQLQNLATNLEEFWNDGGGKGRVIFAGDK